MAKKEKDLNEISTIDNNDLVRIVTANGESVSILLSKLLTQTFIMKSFIGYDINDLYKECSSGLSIFSFSSDGVNLNTPTNLGMVIHVQRQGKGSVSTSQAILDIFIYNKVHIRNGKGNGQDITFTDWREI